MFLIWRVLALSTDVCGILALAIFAAWIQTLPTVGVPTYHVADVIAYTGPPSVVLTITGGHAFIGTSAQSVAEPSDPKWYFEFDGTGHMPLMLEFAFEANPPGFCTAGVRYTRITSTGGRLLDLPLVYVATALMLPLAIRLAFWMRHRCKRKPDSRCQKCGYDLRASTERCPECGTAMERSISKSSLRDGKQHG